MEKSTEINNRRILCGKGYRHFEDKSKRVSERSQSSDIYPNIKIKEETLEDCIYEVQWPCWYNFKSVAWWEPTMLVMHKIWITSNIKPGVLARCFDVTSLLMTKRAQKTGKEVNSFYQCAILKDCWKSIVKLRNLRKKSGTYLQKSSEFLSIQRNLFDIIVKFFVFFLS